VAVEPHLRLRADLGHHRLNPLLRVAENERTGRVHAVHTLRSGVDHDPGLAGQLSRTGAVRHHQEADSLHAEITGQPEMLDGDVGLGAVGRDPGDRGTGVACTAQVVHGADPRHQQHGNRSLGGLLDARPDQRQLVLPGEAVVERRPAKPVAVRYLDDGYASGI
jgi:hypothetical protein